MQIIRRKPIRRESGFKTPLNGYELAAVTIYCRNKADTVKRTDVMRQGLHLFFKEQGIQLPDAKTIVAELGAQWAKENGIPLPEKEVKRK